MAQSAHRPGPPRAGVTTLPRRRGKQASGSTKIAKPALEVVKMAERNPQLQASGFLDQELSALRGLAQAMRACDGSSDTEFTLFVRRAATADATGVDQKGVAAKLFLAPLTLQRWSRGDHLPFPLPRRGYLDGLATLVERRIEALELHGVHALLATPRKGARRSAARAG